MAEFPSVADVIQQLRSDLETADSEGDDHDIRFGLGEIQL